MSGAAELDPWMRLRSRARRALQAIAFILGCGIVLGGLPAAAVLLGSPDGTVNTSAPSPDPGWDHVGTIGNLTGVYLGDGYVLTANHVGTGTIVLDGIAYPPIPGSEVRLRNVDMTYADLRVFALALPHPPLPPLEISSTTPALGTRVIMIGHGRDRGASTSWMPTGGGPPISGYSVASTRTMRWGENEVELIPMTPILGTEAFASYFDLTGPSLTYEAQDVNGDSGGAAFIDTPSGWELAGILYAAGLYQNQPSDLALDGNASYAADLSFYRDEILGIIAAPEPGPAPLLLAGSVELAWLASRRRVTGSVTPR